MRRPATLLPRFVGDQAPFNPLDETAKRAAGLGFGVVQAPRWDGRRLDG
ncbi:MAG: hypothetical protein OXP09_09690 [Gammaproteobacteria bacterium]|nr:hypothetical protein [Gammaproteobacteria bacterium]MDE0365830.1 hypothetical protein [Gammaproteobacteria bacterium]